jgi:diguanylate cyclase (GGDEF)-like protein
MDEAESQEFSTQRMRALRASAWGRAERLYAGAMFAAAVGALAFAASLDPGALTRVGFAQSLFFLVYGLVTISIGYLHPRFGYYSFDRVAQVASILVLGPVAAAAINGLASLLYPWHRLWKGAPLPNVVFAALNNAGIMTLIILASGHVYTTLGGDVPLTSLSAPLVLELLALVLCMQALNDLGMLGLLYLRGRSLSGFFNWFSYTLELGSGATAVLVALVYTRLDTAIFALLLGVLIAGMLALRQFANMRHRLEALVAKRTKSLEEKTRELELQATRDNLTGLYNRRYADAYLEQQLARSARVPQQLSVTLADIDFFKQINDRHSHATGDAVLRRVADILRARCRETDVIARYGGEEFLICFPDTTVAEAHKVCEQLRTEIEAHPWRALGLPGKVTISFGVAACAAGLSVQAVINEADTRLYSAKNAGRNRVVA